MSFKKMKMKNILLVSILFITLLSCSNNDDNNTNVNPFLAAPSVNFSLSLNLPEYDPLKFPGNSVIISNQGIKGVVVYNVNNDLYTAFELSDPNHIPNSCSKMEVEGILANCQCNDNNKYDIVTGKFTPTNNTKYPMLQYRAIREGDVINVFN